MANIFKKENGNFSRIFPPINTSQPYWNQTPSVSSANNPIIASGAVVDQPQPRTLPLPTSSTPPPTRTLSSTPSPYTPPQATSTPTPAPTTQPQTTNPYDAFNLLLQDALKTAQKIDTTDLLKSQRALQRQAIERSRGQGITPPTAEELRFLSPTQQEAMRSADVGALSPSIDEIAYQIKRLDKERADLLEQVKFAGERGDKVRDFSLKEQTLEENIRSNKEAERIANIKANEPKALTAAQEAKKIADQEKATTAQQQATQGIAAINSLLSGDRYKAISGAIQTGSIPFLGDRAAVSEYNQLTGLLKLGIRGLIKGQGQVSDYEGKILGEASSSLSRLTNESQMRDALLKARGVLKTNNGQITSVEVTNPETGEVVTADLSGAEIYQLVSEGNSIKYK